MDETGLPTNDGGQEAPPPVQGNFAPMPAEKPKLKTHAGLLVAGLLAPLALSLITGVVGGLLANVANGAFSAVIGIIGLAGPVLFVGVLIAFLVGKQRGNAKLMSFGKGGLIAYGAMFLLALLAFGSCVVMGLPV